MRKREASDTEPAENPASAGIQLKRPGASGQAFDLVDPQLQLPRKVRRLDSLAVGLYRLR
jgi:hypothetical protein